SMERNSPRLQLNHALHHEPVHEGHGRAYVYGAARSLPFSIADRRAEQTSELDGRALLGGKRLRDALDAQAVHGFDVFRHISLYARAKNAVCVELEQAVFDPPSYTFDGKAGIASTFTDHALREILLQAKQLSNERSL